MTIEKTIAGAAAALKIIGRLDTTTAPELEATIDACAAGITDLVLDCTALEYVSSAGLRVMPSRRHSLMLMKELSTFPYRFRIRSAITSLLSSIRKANNT
ncbi:MAG: STAS domain-containing protein [Lachnospiraceae bacterium]|nr:STAS domain-containing protein [Lachnospiraceae bacterium]